MTRFVALGCLLAGCAMAAEPRIGSDASELDGSVADAPPDGFVPADAQPDAAPDACVAVAELCNAADEDCDNAIDEDLGLGMPCDGANDTDACTEGVVMCDGAGSTTCSDATGSTVELCNNVDDDCRNGIDDGFNVGTPCSEGVGACAAMGQRVCDAAMTGTRCTATPGTPSTEICGNSIDEDCDGSAAACPTNDRASGAINISAGGTFTVDLTHANDDNYATASGLNCGSTGGRDVFYQFTLPVDEVIYWDTFGSNYDTVVRIFAGSCTSLGAVMACADDACNEQRSLSAGNFPAGTYCLVVDQYSANSTLGNTTLTFRRGGRSGIPLPNLNGTVTGTTTGRTNQSTATCEPNSNQPDVGYFYLSCPNTTLTVSADTCSGTAFDSILYMRTGRAVAPDNACEDDTTGCGNNLQARITNASISGGNLHWIIVDGFGQTGNGNYSLTYSVQ